MMTRIYPNSLTTFYTWAPAGGGQEGALAPPWKFTDMGGPPKDNLTRNLKKKIKGTPYTVSEETDLGGTPIASKETDLRGPPYSM